MLVIFLFLAVEREMVPVNKTRRNINFQNRDVRVHQARTRQRLRFGVNLCKSPDLRTWMIYSSDEAFTMPGNENFSTCRQDSSADSELWVIEPHESPERLHYLNDTSPVCVWRPAVSQRLVQIESWWEPFLDSFQNFWVYKCAIFALVHVLINAVLGILPG